MLAAVAGLTPSIYYSMAFGIHGDWVALAGIGYATVIFATMLAFRASGYRLVRMRATVEAATA